MITFELARSILGFTIIGTALFANIPQFIKMCYYRRRKNKNKIGERCLISYIFYCGVNIMLAAYGAWLQPIDYISVITNTILFVQAAAIMIVQYYFLKY